MGWSSGTSLFERIAERLKNTVRNEELRTEIYIILIDEFEDDDWDNIDEVTGIDSSLDKAIRELYPDFEF